MDLTEAIKALNDEQKEVVRYLFGPCIVIAGPGAGKTRVLVTRTANMIYNGIPPENILLFTFTRKAANDIKRKVIETIGNEAKNITVGTYHSVCSRILRNYATYAGLTDKYSIYDPTECKAVIDNILKANTYKLSAKEIISQISLYKRKMMTPAIAAQKAENSIQKTYAEIYKLYEDKMKSCNAVDFDDLIFKTIKILEQNPQIKEEVNNKYRYVVADESHDSSIMDLRLIYLLAGETQNICLICDNDQSIYAFRGSKIEAMMNMKNVFTNTKIFMLSINYRSTGTIVDASRSLINNNTKLIDKNLKAKGENGNPILCYMEKTQEKEAMRIKALVELCTQKYNFKYSDVAILYRKNTQAKYVEQALLEAKIPYAINHGVNFYDRAEIKDILAYFKFIANPIDNLAFLRIKKFLKCGIGDKTLDKIYKYIDENQCDILEACENVLTGKNKEIIEEFIGILNNIEENMDKLPTRKLLELLIEKIDYINQVRKNNKPVDYIRIENNIQRLLEISENYNNIEELTDNIVLDPEASNSNSNPEDEDNTIKLMTMHSSKGLEWNIVIIIGAAEGNNPHYLATTPNEVEEERRLFYVAMTRAKKLLFITYSKTSKENNKFVFNKPSRFIDEISPKFLYKKYGK